MLQQACERVDRTANKQARRMSKITRGPKFIFGDGSKFYFYETGSIFCTRIRLPLDSSVPNTRTRCPSYCLAWS